MTVSVQVYLHKIPSYHTGSFCFNAPIYTFISCCGCTISSSCFCSSLLAHLTFNHKGTSNITRAGHGPHLYLTCTLMLHWHQQDIVSHVAESALGYSSPTCERVLAQFNPELSYMPSVNSGAYFLNSLYKCQNPGIYPM